MKCPGNPEHKGIRIVRLNLKRPELSINTYANALCAECGLWIARLDRNDARAILLSEEKRTGRKQEIRINLLPDEAREQIREIVRDEIGKRFG